MSVPVRNFNFTSLTGSAIYGDNVDSEFDQLYNLLSGLSSNRRVIINFGGSEPPLKLNQTGAGDLFKAQVNGVDAFTINNTGQIISTVLTGTAPIEVSSQTLITNLNADLVNGIQGSQLIRNDQTGQALQANLRIKKASTGTYDVQVEVENDILTFYRYNPSNDTRVAIFSISALNSSTRLLQLSSDFRLQVGYEPTSDNDVVRKIDLTNRSTVLTVPDIISVASSTARGCFFSPNAECVITGVKYGFLTGTGSADLTLTFNYSSTQNFTLVTAAIAENVYSASFTPVTLAANSKSWISTGSASTGHNNIFVQLVGYYTGK